MRVTVTREGLFALPFDEFIQEAIKQNEAPPQDHKWRSSLWEFTRWIKARKEVRGLNGYDGARMVEVVLTRHTAKGKDPWDFHFGNLVLISDPRAEFIDTWDKVKIPANMDALTVASQGAKERPLRPTRIYSSVYCEFVSLAGHLQRGRPGQVIALPVERIAEILNCNRKSVSLYLKFALREGLITKVSDCVPHHRAAEFTFAIDRFDWATLRQLP